MTVKATRAAFLSDSAYILRDLENGAETTSAIEEGVKIFSRKGPYWSGDQNAETYNVGITVTDIETASGQSYLMTFWSHNSATALGAIELLSIPVKQTGSFQVTLDRSAFDEAFPNDQDIFIRVGVTMTGDDTRITFGAVLTPN